MTKIQQTQNAQLHGVEIDESPDLQSMSIDTRSQNICYVNESVSSRACKTALNTMLVNKSTIPPQIKKLCKATANTSNAVVSGEESTNTHINLDTLDVNEAFRLAKLHYEENKSR
jgi:hypothetical protein